MVAITVALGDLFVIGQILFQNSKIKGFEHVYAPFTLAWCGLEIAAMVYLYKLKK